MSFPLYQGFFLRNGRFPVTERICLDIEQPVPFRLTTGSRKKNLSGPNTTALTPPLSLGILFSRASKKDLFSMVSTPLFLLVGPLKCFFAASLPFLGIHFSSTTLRKNVLPYGIFESGKKHDINNT